MCNFEYIDLLGKPFRLGSRGPDHFDCWGICLEIGRRVGILYPEDFTPDNKVGQDKAIKEKQDQDFVKIEKPEAFCIVTFSIKRPLIDHCGIVLSDLNHFVHITRNHSVTRQRLDHKILSKHIDGFYRLRENGIS